MKIWHEKQVGPHLLIYLLSLAFPVVLYFNRHLDDNRLTSWYWVFDHVDFHRPGFVIAGSLVLAVILSRYSFYEKRKAVVLFAVSYGLASCFWSVPEVIVDSARYFTQAKQLSVYGIDFFAEQWGKKIFAWTDLPLVPFMDGLIFKLFGEQRVFIQALNTLFFALTVMLTYQLGKDLWDEETGFYGGLLLLGYPYLYSQVPLLLVDVPTMFFFMLGVVATVKALKKGGAHRIILAGLSLFLVFYIKFSTWILLTLIPIICFYYIYLNPRQAIKRTIGTALVALVLIGVFFLIYKDVLAQQLAFLMEYQKPGLKRWGESYISTFLFQIHPFVSGAALVGCWAAVRKADFR